MIDLFSTVILLFLTGLTLVNCIVSLSISSIFLFFVISTQLMLRIYLNIHKNRLLKKYPGPAYNYAKKRNKPFPYGEPAIATDAQYSVVYAKDILNGPFPLGEPAIASSPNASFIYAKDILKGPFPLGEPAIAKYAHYAFWYARDILKKRFPLGEKAIIYDDDIYLSKYLYEIIVYERIRWPEAEQRISFSPELSYNYAVILNSRFVLGESIIAKSGFFAFLYARDILKERFLIAEQAILTSNWANEYRSLFLDKHKNWPQHGF